MAEGNYGINLDELVQIYRTASGKDEALAMRMVAEALTSESTASVSNSAEAIATIAADAVRNLVSKDK